MKNINYRNCLRYVFIGATIFCVCAFLRNLLNTKEIKDIVGVISDCFIVPGVLLSGIALVSWIGSKGTFDMIKYGFRILFVLNHRSSSYERFEDFYDYKKSKDEKGRKWHKDMFIAGLGFFALGLLCFIIYLLI